MKILLSLLLCLVMSPAFSQDKKKVVYLDTLGNTIDLMESISIQNTGRYVWMVDNSNDEVKYLKWRPITKREYDTLKAITYQQTLIPEIIGEPFVYGDFTDVNGVVYSKEKLKDKVLVINFWFVGCGPCKVEMPELNELYDAYRDNDSVLFISFARSSASKVTKFLSKNAFNYPVIIMTPDMGKQFKVSSFPTNYIVDRNGHYHHASRGIGVAAIDILAEKIETALNK